MTLMNENMELINSDFFNLDVEKNPIMCIASNKPVDCDLNKNIFGGLFNKVLLGMHIVKVIYSDPATIVFWSDGTKTTAKVQEGDTYNREAGLMLCVLKKLLGSVQVNNLFRDWASTMYNTVDLSMVRAQSKDRKKQAKKEMKKVRG